ncbi:VOC family protein [Dyella flagellata]|uniref:Cysteine transferase n=1 Tax=Dyella flagellata TaxID=1867833 RepID=A0ABQ5XIF5_9GAMM|nr:VOC family protein [Dyella flagellata]GLQ90722.1 cysteine transferase [Dyella flagellata]
MVLLDHFILDVKDVEASIAFYTQILGFTHEGREGPFAVIRVNRQLVMLLSSRAPQTTEHYAFALPSQEFQVVITRIKAAGMAYGPSFNTVGSNTGPGDEAGARGLAATLYFHDPSGHLLEIRHYESDQSL